MKIVWNKLNMLKTILVLVPFGAFAGAGIGFTVNELFLAFGLASGAAKVIIVLLGSATIGGLVGWHGAEVLKKIWPPFDISEGV